MSFTVVETRLKGLFLNSSTYLYWHSVFSMFSCRDLAWNSEHNQKSIIEMQLSDIIQFKRQTKLRKMVTFDFICICFVGLYMDFILFRCISNTKTPNRFPKILKEDCLICLNGCFSMILFTICLIFIHIEERNAVIIHIWSYTSV